MHLFLCTYLHWLSSPFLWIHHLLYAPWTFVFVVFIGFAQTTITWLGGELAIRALPKNLLSYKYRKKCLLLVRTLALLLLLATLYIAINNDRGQRDADDRAARALADESIVQAKLDEANTRAKHAEESFDAFAKSLDPSKLTMAQYVRLIQANQDATRAAGVTSSHEMRSPFLSMSNSDLRDAIHKFVRQIQSENFKMYDKFDGIGRERNAIQMQLSQKKPAPQDLKQSLQANEQALDAFINSIVQADVPTANSYLSELNRRLGAHSEQIAPFTAVPDVPSFNSFAQRVAYLDVLAGKLPT